MPFAGTSIEVSRHELKSLPGAWVDVRRMTYGQKLERQNMLKLGIEMNSRSKDVKGELAMANKEATYLDFKNCVVDHNLFKDEAETQKINFASRMDVDLLNPRVGEEIDRILNELNNFEEGDEAKN